MKIRTITSPDGTQSPALEISAAVGLDLVKVASVPPEQYVNKVKQLSRRAAIDALLSVHEGLREAFNLSADEFRQLQAGALQGRAGESKREKYLSMPAGRARALFLGEHLDSIIPKAFDAGTTDPDPPTAILEEYRSLPAGPERMAFYKKHKDALEAATKD